MEETRQGKRADDVPNFLRSPGFKLSRLGIGSRPVKEDGLSPCSHLLFFLRGGRSFKRRVCQVVVRLHVFHFMFSSLLKLVESALLSCSAPCFLSPVLRLNVINRIVTLSRNVTRGCL